MSKHIGLGNIPQSEFKKKPDMSKPKAVKPKEFEHKQRTMPDDNVLVHYKGKISKKYIPKSTRLQEDAHVALKTISIAENKPIREVINDMIEQYIQGMPEGEKKLVIPQIKAAQENMEMPENEL